MKIQAPQLKNLTHYSKLFKANPDAPILKSITRAQDVLDNYAKDLAKDPTRTEPQKMKLLHEAAQNQAMALLKQVDIHRDNITAKLEPFHSRINSVMEVKGTTDLMILQSMALATADLTNVELYTLTQTEPDAARAALLLPVSRFKRKLNTDPKSAEFLKNALVEVVLGNDHAGYQQLLAQESDTHTLGGGILDAHAHSVNAANEIQDNVAIAPAVGG